MSLSDADFTALEKRLGHVFSNKRLLDRALTHRSAGSQAEGSYERLEFLGDRVLGLVIADLLLQRFPKDPEGHLSRRFNAMVRKETLADVARDLGLGKEIRFGQYEEADGADNPAILSDVCEALIAALYRDAGLESARDFILRNWEARLETDPTPPRDGKSALQEWTMARGLGLPHYEEIARSGPDHAPVFTMRVSVPKHGSAQAEGRVKRHAEQTAAEQLLESLKNDG
ncbi:MAG: ribonuclease III [Alphaproteobacteria bacterium]|nr:ribonuclease III [Alphaproteobacteria bacterium]